MLQSLRNNIKGAGAVIIVGIIIVPFALFGVETLFSTGSDAKVEAKVNGEIISEFDVLQALEISKQQLLEQYKDLDLTQIDTQFMQTRVLERLITEKVIQQQASKTGMAVADDTIYPLLLDVPAYQIDGKFSPNRYEYIIAQMGYTPTSHADAISDEMLQRAFIQGVIDSGFNTYSQVDQLIGLLEQTRNYYYLTIPAAPLLQNTVVGEAEINDYYQKNSTQFIDQEAVKVEYVLLDLAALLDQVSVDEQAIEAAYQNKINSFVAPQTRKVAHILIDQDSLNTAPDLLDTIQAKLDGGESFASLAKEFSVDYASAEQEGVIGYVSKGDLPESLELVLDTMSTGMVSKAVESDAGFHFLQLLDIQQSDDVPTIESLRPELELTLKKELASSLFAAKVETMKEVSYNASSLQETAQTLKTELIQSEYFPRSGGEGITGYAELVQAAYSDDVLIDGYPSSVIELDGDKAVVIRLLDHKQQSVKPLEMVREQVEKGVRQTHLEEQFQSIAAELKEKVIAGESLEDIAKARGYSWQVVLDAKTTTTGLDQQVQSFVFSLPMVGDHAVVDGFVNAQGDYHLVALTSTQRGDSERLSQEQKNLFRQQYDDSVALQELASYQQYLKQQADIEQ